jgi:tetratricopeptide (TPR) repeat protein
MRAEHRHELKTNTLAEWLINLPAWARQNARMITYASVVIVFVVASYFYHRYQKTVVASREQSTMTAILSQMPQQSAYIARQAEAEGIDTSYMLLQTAETLEGIANSTRNDAVAAMSLIKEAEILRTELHFRLGTVSQQDLATQVNRAKQIYTKALDTYLKRSPNPSLEALAKLGLGLCEEELGNLDKAREIYKEVATAAFEGTTAAVAAKQRLASMDSFSQKLVLKPAPAAPTAMPQAPVMQNILEQTPPAVSETNMPGLN